LSIRNCPLHICHHVEVLMQSLTVSMINGLDLGLDLGLGLGLDG